MFAIVELQWDWVGEIYYIYIERWPEKNRGRESNGGLI
jgi:hypothetical protein